MCGTRAGPRNGTRKRTHMYLRAITQRASASFKHAIHLCTSCTIRARSFASLAAGGACVWSPIKSVAPQICATFTKSGTFAAPRLACASSTRTALCAAVMQIESAGKGKGRLRPRTADATAVACTASARPSGGRYAAIWLKGR